MRNTLLAQNPRRGNANPRQDAILQAAVEDFETANPQFGTVSGAHCHCYAASMAFAATLPNAIVIQANSYVGPRIIAPPQPLGGWGDSEQDGFLWCHSVAVWRGLAIDWTARQFEPEADFPFVRPYKDFRRDWEDLDAPYWPDRRLSTNSPFAA